MAEEVISGDTPAPPGEGAVATQEEETAAEAATKALGTQVDIASLEVRESESSIELRGLAIADPFDPRRNVIAAERIRVELEPTPLLEKKLIIRRLAVGGVRLGTARSEPARRIDDNGFAATTLRSIREWAAKYRHPVLALTPIDTIRKGGIRPDAVPLFIHTGGIFGLMAKRELF